MQIAVAKERRDGERRVAATPDSVKKLIALGAEVAVESGAGAGASFADAAYEAAGATIAKDYATAVAGADILLKVRAPLTNAEARGKDKIDEVSPLPKGCRVIGMLAPHGNVKALDAYAAQGITAMALELVPRITRAQAMDVLSSQSNLAGYKAVVIAADHFDRAFPMMMTAAGTIPPARVVIVGAGVAGLQAIATARRLGAIVSAFDVRAAAKEQVQSLGASFVEVEGAEDMETAGGYAKEASEDYKKRQAAALSEHLKKQDIVITTALIPGRAAPRIVTEDMIKGMKPGSIIVDMAVEAGGNCALSKPDEVVEAHGVRIVGQTNLPSHLSVDASQLYARNLVAYLTPLIDQESKTLKLDWEDEIVAATVLTHEGKIVHPDFTSAAKVEKPVAEPTAPTPDSSGPDESGPDKSASNEQGA
ncbi:MAG: Re/Si-specific NAD(P)(+) transhydrogenase subunit alpha [Rhodospirillaceae bacterium]|nr:Re/Si-specific NAD(P)(+) transhydrogenase subunit alpha [Rhodospirillaceae bacterium]